MMQTLDEGPVVPSQAMLLVFWCCKEHWDIYLEAEYVLVRGFECLKLDIFLIQACEHP